MGVSFFDDTVSALKHGNIVQHKQFIPEIGGVVVELAEMGTLENYLTKQKDPIGWPLKLKWAMQLTEVLEFMHSKGIIHRKADC